LEKKTNPKGWKRKPTLRVGKDHPKKDGLLFYP